MVKELPVQSKAANCFFFSIEVALDTVTQYTPYIFKHRKHGTTRKHIQLWTQMPQVETHDVHSGSLFALNENLRTAGDFKNPAPPYAYENLMKETTYRA